MIPASATPGPNLFNSQLERVSDNDSEANVPAPTEPRAQENPPGWAPGGLGTGTARAGAASLVLTLIPVLKKAAPELGNALPYFVAGFAGPTANAGITRCLPDGSKEFTVAPENAALQARLKFCVIAATYFTALTANDQLSKHVSGPGATVGGLAISAGAGQVVTHFPFILQTLLGNEVMEQDVTRATLGKTLVTSVMTGMFGAAAGGVVDAANAILKSIPASDLEHVPPEVTSYIPLAVAVLIFAGLASFAPPHIQNFMNYLSSSHAANAQNNPGDVEMQDLPPAVDTLDSAAQEERTPSDGLVVHPTVNLSSPPTEPPVNNAALERA